MKKTIIKLSFEQQLGLQVVFLALALIAISVVEPIPQDPNYRLFADKRSLFGIPNSMPL